MSLVVSMGWRYWETTTKMIADWKLISSCFCWINFHDYQGRQTTKWNFFPSRKREVFMLFSWIYIRLDLFVTLWLKVKSIKLLGIADWYNPWFSWETQLISNSISKLCGTVWLLSSIVPVERSDWSTIL